MTRRAQAVTSSYDRQSNAAWVSFAVFFWLLAGVFLVLRDPLWRLLFEGQILGGAPNKSAPSVELDQKLLLQLEKADVSPRSGNDALESEIVAAISDRVQKEVPEAANAMPPLNNNETLRNVARAHAQARAGLGDAVESQPPELRFSDLYLSMIRPGQLTRAVEIHQELSGVPPKGSTVPAELVGGWMNNMSFDGMIRKPFELNVGVGAVTVPPRGKVSLDALLIQTFLRLDRPLPSVLKLDSPLILTGRRLSPDEVTLYFKGPSDASFSPISAQWVGDKFSCNLQWSQGKGTYALRARRGDRLSDPRLLLVK